MILSAVAGQVNEHQVFRAGALGECLHRAGDGFTRRHRPVIHVIAMIDQADLPDGTEARLEQIAHVVRLAHEHALLAVATHDQRVQLGGGCRRRHCCQCLVQQRTLDQQPGFKWIRQQFAFGITDPLAVGPDAALLLAIGGNQHAVALVGVIGELADVAAAIGQ